MFYVLKLQTSISTGVPLTCFLAPPVDTCLQCSASLHVHNHPVRVVCYTQDGPVIALKLTLRCRACGLNYRYEQYGSTNNGGYRYYDQPRPFVQASQVCYVDRVTCEQWIAARYTVMSLLVTNAILHLIVDSVATMPGQVLMPQLRSIMSFTGRQAILTCTIWSNTSVFIP